MCEKTLKFGTLLSALTKLVLKLDQHAGFWGKEVPYLRAMHSVRSTQDSLEAAGLEMSAQTIWAKERFALDRGHCHWQHEPCRDASTDCNPLRIIVGRGVRRFPGRINPHGD